MRQEAVIPIVSSPAGSGIPMLRKLQGQVLVPPVLATPLFQ